MVNGASRRSHASKDERRGKPTSVGAYAGERLSLTGLGKALQGKPRSKPESGNPTFRDCRGGSGKRGPWWKLGSHAATERAAMITLRLTVSRARILSRPREFVPPGSNRSSGGVNEAAEAFGGEGRK